jgi:hypothetical protein
MISAIRQLDRILRGEATRPDVLREEGIRFPVAGLAFVLLLLGGIYGVCMGVYAQTDSGSGSHMQMLASALKVPSLFALTLLVTLPSLYVFNALLGSKLTFGPLLRLMVGAGAVTMSVLSSIGPIVAFFSISTTSYAFMVLLNVVVFAISGFLGLTFLKQTLNRLTAASAPARPTTTTPLPFETPILNESGEIVGHTTVDRPWATGALDPTEDNALGRHTRKVFTIWMLVFGVVGAQMAWILRPFIGSPNTPFTWFRPRGSNFFESVWHHIQYLFS